MSDREHVDPMPDAELDAPLVDCRRGCGRRHDPAAYCPCVPADEVQADLEQRRRFVTRVDAGDALQSPSRDDEGRPYRWGVL